MWVLQSEDLVVLRLDASGITDSVYFNGTVVIYRSFNAPGVFAVPYLLSLTGANQPIVFGELEVTVVNQPPVAAADRYTVAPHSVNPTTQLNVLENDSDPGLDDLQIRLCNSGGVGQCAISSDNQTLLYTTPSDSQVGDVINISYEVEDPFGGISSANVRILVDFAGLRIVDTSPINGEEGVALTRETVFTFSHPINIAVNLFDVFEVTFAGQSYPFRAHLSADRYRITLFYTNTLPPSATMRVRVNGVLLLDDNAEALFNTEVGVRFRVCQAGCLVFTICRHRKFKCLFHITVHSAIFHIDHSARIWNFCGRARICIGAGGWGAPSACWCCHHCRYSRRGMFSVSR